MATIGFIGLGNMGGPMTRNLIQAGHGLKVFDLDEEKVNLAAQAGAVPCASIAEAVAGVEVVVTMLPEGGHVREVHAGEGGVLAHVADGVLLIDSSTIDVASARAVHEAAAARGLEMLDAPVSGGTPGAEAATLTFMCGGTAETFHRARPVLEGMGKNIVHCGGPGLGQVAKICNNMIAGISIIAVSEAFVLAERQGLDHQVLYDVVSTSSGSCSAMVNSCPVPGPVPTSAANRDFEPGFMAALMYKDLNLSQAAAREVGAASPLGAAAAAIYGLYAGQGQGHKDSTGVINLIRGMTQAAE